MRLVYILTITTLWSLHLWPDSPNIDQYFTQMFSNDFGHTLVGAKPASLDESTYRLKRSTTLYKNFVHSIRGVFDGSTNFIFREIGQSLWLINVREMTRMINKHPSFKKFIVNNFGTIDEFFRYLRYGEKDVFEIFEHNNDLIAITLGYGLDNGRYYERRKIIGRYLRKYPITGIYPFEILPCVYYVTPLHNNYLWHMNEPPKLPQFTSLEEEWEWILQKKWDLDDESVPKLPYYIWLPSYTSCKSEEAREVHRGFVRARNKLAKLFSSNKPREVISYIALKDKTQNGPSNTLPQRERREITSRTSTVGTDGALTTTSQTLEER